MSDYTSDGPLHHVKKVPRAESFAYFTLIFVLGLLPQTLAWIYQTARHGSLPDQGPVTRAWKDAQVITPQIFRG
jgi:hypothetical protein